MTDRAYLWLWLLAAALAGVLAFRNAGPRPAAETTAVSVLMPMYTSVSLDVDPRLRELAIPIPPDVQSSGEAQGVAVVEGLTRTSVFGPTTGPEEIAMGLLLMMREPGLQPAPNQSASLRESVRLIRDKTKRIEALSGEIHGEYQRIECLKRKLARAIETKIDGESIPPCSLDEAAGAELWNRLARELEGPR